MKGGNDYPITTSAGHRHRSHVKPTSGSPSNRKMPPILRLDSTGEVAKRELPGSSRTNNRPGIDHHLASAANSIFGSVMFPFASHSSSVTTSQQLTGGKSSRSVFQGIRALDELIQGKLSDQVDMASHMNSQPYAKRATSAHMSSQLTSAGGHPQWGMMNYSSLPQGVFPCHVFQAMQSQSVWPPLNPFSRTSGSCVVNSNTCSLTDKVKQSMEQATRGQCVKSMSDSQISTSCTSKTSSNSASCSSVSCPSMGVSLRLVSGGEKLVNGGERLVSGGERLVSGGEGASHMAVNKRKPDSECGQFVEESQPRSVKENCAKNVCAPTSKTLEARSSSSSQHLQGQICDSPHIPSSRASSSKMEKETVSVSGSHCVQPCATSASQCNSVSSGCSLAVSVAGVCVSSPQPCVSSPAPQPCVSNPAPQPCVSSPAPQPCVSNPAPQPCVSSPAPQPCQNGIALSAKCSATPAKDMKNHIVENARKEPVMSACAIVFACRGAEGPDGKLWSAGNKDEQSDEIDWSDDEDSDDTESQREALRFFQQRNFCWGLLGPSLSGQVESEVTPVSCPLRKRAVAAANTAWNTHYPDSQIPCDKLHSKVQFACGTDVDRVHVYEKDTTCVQETIQVQEAEGAERRKMAAVLNGGEEEKEEDVPVQCRFGIDAPDHLDATQGENQDSASVQDVVDGALCAESLSAKPLTEESQSQVPEEDSAFTLDGLVVSDGLDDEDSDDDDEEEEDDENEEDSDDDDVVFGEE